MALISIYLFLRLFISSAWGVAPRQAFHLGTISQSLFWLMTSVHGCPFAILEKYLTFFIENVNNITKCLDSYYHCENLGDNMESIACGVCKQDVFISQSLQFSRTVYQWKTNLPNCGNCTFHILLMLTKQQWFWWESAAINACWHPIPLINDP